MKVCTQYPYKFPFLKIKVQVDIIFKALYGLKRRTQHYLYRSVAWGLGIANVYAVYEFTLELKDFKEVKVEGHVYLNFKRVIHEGTIKRCCKTVSYSILI